ncbi:helix-turn-helix transcriptional regulator [Pseudonocardia kujensis]|uniref:response regulator transcription factor n=1 Tax=Pseudonocardia kujensis TaxID=1128675 RepID=UPI001E4C8FE8|nr:helix-turn-helix transcriptional regulator [Pseudonocardia kujensis]MCE0764959.1 helix-turn-helix transcriptional regulator [Pseudonocardia kujensis]
MSIRLIPRERDVLALVARGWTNSEIGLRLRVGWSTVKGHVKNLFRKFEVSRRADLAFLVGPDTALDQTRIRE